MAYEGAVRYPMGWTILFSSIILKKMLTQKLEINQSSVVNTMERSNVLLSKCWKFVGDGEPQNGAVWGHVAESDEGLEMVVWAYVGLGRRDVVDVCVMLSFVCVCFVLFKRNTIKPLKDNLLMFYTCFMRTFMCPVFWELGEYSINIPPNIHRK
jgi:hypothetical protein